MTNSEISDGNRSPREVISNICTALGGFDTITTEEGEFKRVYTVGDEALACLKDLKRLMRIDELKTREILIEYHVLEKDLIPILVLSSTMTPAIAERYILACVEIIVPLTWPIPKEQEETDEYRNPNQLDDYRKIKRKLLDKGVFEAIMRLCIKSLQIPYRDRSTRDQSIIRLTLYFFRNLTAIADPKVSGISSGEQVILSKLQERLLIRCQEANVLELLLTMASTTGTTDSDEWYTALLEIIYNLLEFADAKATASVDAGKKKKNQTSNNATTNRLTSLLDTESIQKRRKTRHAPSRHNRFGGAYTLKSWDGSNLVTHKQSGGYADLDQLISLQQKNRSGMKRKQVDEIGTHNSYEDPDALCYLKQFGLTFLQSCFNKFYPSILKVMKREDKTIVERDYTRFYYTQRWFLELFVYEFSAIQARKREEEKEKQEETNNQLFLPNRHQETGTSNGQQNTDSTNNTLPTTSEGSSTAQEAADATAGTNHNGSTPGSTFDYALIADVMDLNMFWACMQRVRQSIDDKLWLDVQITADCLRLLLVVLGIMARSTQSEYQDVAEYIQSNIYHEKWTLDIFPDLIRTYRNQSFGYIASSVKLIHTILKMLEQYSKKQEVLFVRKKKTQRKLPTKVSDASGPVDEEMDGDDSDDSQTEEDRDRQIAYREQSMTFASFEKRFATYDFVRVSSILLEDYQNLEPEVLSAITNVFHRIMVRTKIEHLFWKLPTLELFNRILKDRGYTPKSQAGDELRRFIFYVVRQFFKKAQTYPLLFIEMLFKIEPCRVPENKNSTSSQ